MIPESRKFQSTPMQMLCRSNDRIYKNRDHRLPVAIGRVWYEADFDYVRGYRNGCRLLYSNDGLIFVTYDHYFTFYEIGLEAIR